MQTPRCWSLPAAAFLFVLTLPGCGASGQQQAAEKPDPAWLDFPQYRGARPLCSQSVVGSDREGGVEINWRSWASHDPAADVIAFYSKQKIADADVTKDPFSIHRGTDVLSIHSAGAHDHPSCDAKPKPEDQSVIVIARMGKRPAKP